MRLTKAIDGFTIALASERYSPRTTESYKAHLKQLAAFLKDPDVSRIKEADLRRYFAWVNLEYIPKRSNGDTTSLAGSSVNKIWIAVRSFFKWATVEFSLPCNVAQRLKSPEYTTRSIVPFKQDEIRAILRACERSRLKVRNTAIVLVLLDTGLRASELCRLKVGDVNLETGEMFVKPFGSGRKSRSRTVFLGKSAKRAMWRYLASRDTAPTDTLFLSITGTPLNRGALKLLISKLGKSANVANAHPHKFRHTFAIAYLRNNGNVFSLQRLLGHSTLDMTKKYLALAETDDQMAHKSASPVDCWSL